MTCQHVFRVCVALLFGALLLPPPVQAADNIRAGKAINVIWAMVPVDIGVEEGIFAKYGIDVEVVTLTGEAKLQQALVAGSVDVGLAGGSSMVFALKGARTHGIAAIAGAPRNFSVIVAADSPIKTVADLKGRLLSTASSGSFPEWLIKRLATAEGWGPTGIRTTATGGFEASASAMQTHQVDGFMGATEAGYMLEERHVGKILTGMEKYVPHFHNHVLIARDELIHDHPDQIERFLKGYFATVAFMKANRDKTIEISSRVMHMSPAVMSKTYDYEIDMLSPDGAFDPQALQVLKNSYVEMGLLSERPRDDQLLTTQFLPVKF
jgi:ABC-type nitrate/sulfonate/bicarbonate transport system substrate-binding protein